MSVLTVVVKLVTHLTVPRHNIIIHIHKFYDYLVVIILCLDSINLTSMFRRSNCSEGFYSEGL